MYYDPIIKVIVSYLAFVKIAGKTSLNMFCYRSHALYSLQYALGTDSREICKCQTEWTVSVDQMHPFSAEIRPYHQDQLPFLRQKRLHLGMLAFVAAAVVEVWAFALKT